MAASTEFTDIKIRVLTKGVDIYEQMIEVDRQIKDIDMRLQMFSVAYTSNKKDENDLIDLIRKLRGHRDALIPSRTDLKQSYLWMMAYGAALEGLESPSDKRSVPLISSFLT
jgi:hypothetical protein